jgi:hypothetical protein
MNAVRTLILVVALLGGLGWVAVSEGQQPSSPPANFTPAPASKAGTVIYGFPQAGSYARNVSQETVQLAQQYVKATKEDEKKEIRKKLTDVLSQQFDQRLQQQQKEIDDLEKQIASLKEVLKKRTAAKATIVERRIDALVQEAEGLGWNNPSSPHAMNPFYGAGYGGSSGMSGFGRSGQSSSTPAPKAP